MIKVFAFLICGMMLAWTSAFGQSNSLYQRYEKYRKQSEKTLRYYQETRTNYQKYQSYVDKARVSGNTQAQRVSNMWKAQSYYQKAQEQRQKFNESYQKTRQYQREVFSPPIKKVKPGEYSEPKIPRIRNPYQTHSTYNMYQYPQGRP